MAAVLFYYVKNQDIKLNLLPLKTRKKLEMAVQN